MSRSGDGLSLTPVLPAKIRCEPGEYISFWSLLGAGANWTVYPPELGEIAGGAFRGDAPGDGFILGRDGDNAAVASVKVEILTPSDHDILVGIRNELTNHNLFINHMRDSSAAFDRANAKAAALTGDYTDLEVRIAAARLDCDEAYNLLLIAIESYKTDRKTLFELLDEYATISPPGFKKPAPEDKGKSPTVILPSGFVSDGGIVVWPEPVALYTWDDWLDFASLKMDIESIPDYAKDKLSSAASSLVDKAKNVKAAAGNYAKSLSAVLELIDRQSSLPEEAWNLQKQLDAARESKLSALYGLKEHDRRVDEYKLWYRFRRWIESRTIVGKSERDREFAIDTQAFQTSLEIYKKELADSLAALEKIDARVESAPAPLHPEQLPELPLSAEMRRLVSDPQSYFGRGGLLSLESLDRLTKWIEGTSAGQVHENTGEIAEPAIPAGAITAGGLSVNPITREDFASLEMINPANFIAVAADADSLANAAGPEIPRLHSTDKPVESARRRRFKDFLDMLQNYNHESAKWIEKKIATRLKEAVASSLSTVDAILSYMDWRRGYITLAHSGDLDRRMALERLDRVWREAGAGRALTRNEFLDLWRTLTSVDEGVPLSKALLDDAFGQEGGYYSGGGNQREDARNHPHD
ncbi:MAG: hypothetical protein HRF49_01300 [bacterium]